MTGRCALEVFSGRWLSVFYFLTPNRSVDIFWCALTKDFFPAHLKAITDIGYERRWVQYCARCGRIDSNPACPACGWGAAEEQ